MKTAAVLMSTYNGEKYAREQIDSILNQVGVDVTLYIRDDGSQGGTVGMLRQIEAEKPNVHLYAEKNIGVGGSFMDLVYRVPQEYDLYAFADQDDVWLDGKLARAAEMIGDREKPVLYCSNQMLTDAGMNQLGLRHASAPDTSWMQILCNNLLSGCTMVWNRAMQALLADPGRRPSPELLKKRIHDVWVGMAAAVTGEILYDPEAFILYRQHERNVVGVKNAPVWKEWEKKLRNPALRNGRSTLAKETAEKFGDRIADSMIADRLRLYGRTVGGAKESLRLLKDREICRYSGEKEWEYRAKVLMKLF